MSLKSLAPEDYQRLVFATHAAMHPVGQDLAYVRTRFDLQGGRVSDIVLVNPHDLRSSVLALDVADEQPAFAPDGSQLAFLSRHAGLQELRLVDLARQEERVLARFAGTPRAPVWSPDGRSIALEVLDSEGERGPRVLRSLRYNVNGVGFIGERKWRVVLVDVATGTQQTIGDPRYHHFFPAFAPDGGRLALVTTRRELWDVEWVWDVYTVDLNSDRWTRLTSSDGVAMYPAWSPDGSRVAFLHNHSPWTGTTSDYHVMEAPADASAPARCLSHALDRGATDVYEPPLAAGAPPVYTAGGHAVLWLASDRGCRVLQRSACDGSRSTAVAEHVGWPSLDARRGRAALLAYRADRPPEVAMLDLHEGTLRIVTDENPWLRDYGLCREPVRVALPAKGGTSEAVVWRPGEDRKAQPVTIVQFHGGPHGAFGPYFNFAEQMLVSHGYLVASLNYRGSAGYGQAFADLVHADWGPQEGEDGQRLIQRLGELGWSDPTRVGVYGISYGGFMTNWMITHYPDEVQAAVTISTVASLFTSAYGIDHWESIATDMGGPPDRIPGYYHDHSPASYLDKVRTPLLILHGEEDMTCPLIEAEIMFVGLRWRLQEVEFVRYPGESHSFMRIGRVDTIVDAHRRMLAWFDRHLGALEVASCG